MRKLPILAITQTALLCATCVLACEKPATISVPDGETASEAEMLADGDAYSAYMASMWQYQACLEGEADKEHMQDGPRSKSATNARENSYTARHDAASSEMTRITEALQRAVDAYEVRR